jgi:hypothetical protein
MPQSGRVKTILKCEETWAPVGSSFFESYWIEERSRNTFGFRQLFRTFYVSSCNCLLFVEGVLADEI